MKRTIERLVQTPIAFDYRKPDSDLIAELRAKQALCEIKESNGIKVENIYYAQGLPGTNQRVFTRLAILDRLKKIAHLISPRYGIHVFDAFRTRTTQGYLFDSFLTDIRAKHPHWSEDELQKEVRKYVSHPDEPSRFAVPPHNSGGAIDLALFERATGEVLDFGATFDETESISSTTFFEQPYDAKLGISEQRWLQVQQNRRLLFHLMVAFDFTNYQTEWWHYDLGDCMWAHEHGIDYVFASAEDSLRLTADSVLITQ